MASAAQMQSLAWCFSDKKLAEQAAEVEQLLDAQESLRFSSDKEFTHWLFRQPRGAASPSFVLVVGWREAKLCMAAIKAARTGEMDRLRPDKTRPPLIEASPRGLRHVNVTVGAVVVVTTKAEQREKATEWAQSGECDSFVAIRVASGPLDVGRCLRGLLGPQQEPQPQPPQPQQPQPQLLPTLLLAQRHSSPHPQQQPAVCVAAQWAAAQPSAPCEGSGCSGQWESAQPDITRARSSRLRSPSPNYMWPGFAHGGATAAPSRPRRASNSRTRTLPRHDEVADSCRRPPHLVSVASNAASDASAFSAQSSPRGRPASPGSDRSLEEASNAAETRSPSPDYMWPGFSRRGAAGSDEGAEWPVSPGSTVGFQGMLPSPSGTGSTMVLTSPSGSHC